jgi:hypothetical protein
MKEPNELIKARQIICLNLLDVNVTPKLMIKKFIALLRACCNITQTVQQQLIWQFSNSN